MSVLEIVRQTIAAFCVEYVHHPYLCYTEHGQHALFYTRLYSAIPEERRYATWQEQKVCILQKEYPTDVDLGKSKRQHWDVCVLSEPLTSRGTDPESYDHLKLLAAIEFGLNETQAHLKDDIDRLSHAGANVEQGFIVHLYRLFDGEPKLSRRSWSPSSTQILTLETVTGMSAQTPVEIYYGMAGGTGKYETGAWHIKGGKPSRIG